MVFCSKNNTIDYKALARHLKNCAGNYSSFKSFYKSKLNVSEKKGVRSGNEELLIRHSHLRTAHAILYIHGFGACRAEGQAVMEEIAASIKSNIYFLRLPGHGTTPQEHVHTPALDLLSEATEALCMMERLGKEVIVAGTSMGGLISTILAALFPEKVSALILSAPFYEFADIKARLLHNSWFFKKYTHCVKKRVIQDPIPEEDDNWTRYWYREHSTKALRMLVDLAEIGARKELFQCVECPALMFFHNRHLFSQDSAASVTHMKRAFNHFGSTAQEHSKNKLLELQWGDHVLLSKYFDSPKDDIVFTIEEFIQSL